MLTSLITFKTPTAALRAEQVLRAGGIDVHPRRLTAGLKEKGCASGLSLLTQDIAIATALLSRQGIPYRSIYDGEGGM